MIETQKFSTMTRDELKVQFTGHAHDHLMASSRTQSVKANTLHHHHFNSCQPQQQQQQHGCLSSIQDKTNIIHREPAAAAGAKDAAAQPLKQTGASALSTIAILRRETMYDSLVLVKNFRPCLNGYTLEFPTSYVDEQPAMLAGAHGLEAGGRSVENHALECPSKRDHDLGCNRTKLVSVYLDGDDPMYQNPCAGFGGAKSASDIVYVPVNGLLDRLDNFDRHGISIDSRVYAFAMGLKTAERILTSSTEKEIQEAPPL